LQQAPLKIREVGRRDSIGNDDEPIAVELLPKLLRNEAGEATASLPGKGVRSPQPPRVKSRPVQPLGSEQGIVCEGFGARE
jgi:hypothetical protein